MADIKDGNWIDMTGAPIPPRYVGKVDKLRDRLVEKQFKRAKTLSGRILDFRNGVEEDVEAYLAKVEAHYNASARTAEGNKCLTNFSGNRRVEIRIGKFLRFDDRLALAKGLIGKCIKKWSKGANDNLSLLVEDAFKVDKQGNIDRERVLGLRNLHITDRDWKKAMEVISDSLTVVAKKSYVKVSEKDDAGVWKTVSLNVSQV